MSGTGGMWEQLNSDKDCFFIAEIGVNHNGDIDVARDLVDVAADSGADAVKFQTFFAEELVSPLAQKADYQSRNTGGGTQFEMLKELELDADAHRTLKAHCATRDIVFLSTPFSFRAADLLFEIGVDAYKVSSGDLTYLAFLDHLAKRRLPMVVSTGMGTIGEVQDAVDTVTQHTSQVALLHCVSNYPADAGDCNLSAMATMERAFGLPVGWSDHTTGDEIAVAAAALGAKIIEKHFTLDCAAQGPDHSSSLEPDELHDLIRKVRRVSMAAGTGMKTPTAAELRTAKVARRSLVAARNLSVDRTIGEDDMTVLRPGNGIPPKFLETVVGMKLARPVAAGDLLLWSDFSESPK